MNVHKTFPLLLWLCVYGCCPAGRWTYAPVSSRLQPLTVFLCSLHLPINTELLHCPRRRKASPEHDADTTMWSPPSTFFSCQSHPTSGKMLTGLLIIYSFNNYFLFATGSLKASSVECAQRAVSRQTLPSQLWICSSSSYYSPLGRFSDQCSPCPVTSEGCCTGFY